MAWIKWMTASLLLTLSIGVECLAADSSMMDSSAPVGFQKTLWIGHILRKDTARITGLTVPARSQPVFLAAKQGKYRPFIEITAFYDRADWNLFVQPDFQVVRSKDDGEFHVFMYLKNQTNVVQLVAKGPNNAVETENLYIYAPEAQGYRVVSPWDGLFAALGFSNLFYSQTGLGEFSSLTSTADLTYILPEIGRWSLIGDINMTVFTYSSKPVTRGPQLLDAKFDGVYRLTNLDHGRWQSKLLAGGSFLHLFPNGSEFGFSNLMSPEFGFREEFNQNAKTFWMGDLRYVALSAPFGERGIDLSLVWNRALQNHHIYNVGLHIANYYFKADPQTAIHMNLFTLSAGYQLL